ATVRPLASQQAHVQHILQGRVEAALGKGGQRLSHVGVLGDDDRAARARISIPSGTATRRIPSTTGPYQQGRGGQQSPGGAWHRLPLRSAQFPRRMLGRIHHRSTPTQSPRASGFTFRSRSWTPSSRSWKYRKVNG